MIEEIWKDDSKHDVYYKKIVSLLKRELAKNPKDIIALTNLGGAYCDTGRHKEAKVLLKKAIELGSKDKNTFFNLGVALMNTQAQKEAKKYFAKSAKLTENELTYEAYIDFQGY